MPMRTHDPLRAATPIYRLVPRAAFTLLFAFIAVRLLLQVEWFGGGVAGLISVAAGFSAWQSWRRLRMAMGRPPFGEPDDAVEAMETGR